MCAFPAVDCSGMNDACNRASCDAATGRCVKAPANEGSTCGAGKSCGLFGACGGFADTCDSSGSQARSCSQGLCQAGTCATNTFTETQACTRPTEGVTCGAPTVTNCGACGFIGACAETGSKTCTCTTVVCASDHCTTVPTSCTQACTRNTDGDACSSCSSTHFRMECSRGTCSSRTDC